MRKVHVTNSDTFFYSEIPDLVLIKRVYQYTTVSFAWAESYLKELNS